MQKLMTGNGDCWWQTIGYIDVLSCSPGTGNESGGIVGDVGGTTTGTTETTPTPREIIDSVKNECIKSQVALALQAKTTIREMLNNEFGTNNYNDRDITFYDVTNLPDDVVGTTHGENAYSFILMSDKH